MNREIKFRGKRLDNGEWVYGYLADENYINNINEIAMPSEEVDPSTVGQCTGLKDRNGREIYEGDILNNYDEPNPLIVTWDASMCAFTLCDIDGEIESDFASIEIRIGVCIDAEIVGNIHDNPELVK